VKYAVHFEFRQDTLEQRGVGDRPRQLAPDELRERGLERADVDGDDCLLSRRKLSDELVADFAARACD